MNEAAAAERYPMPPEELRWRATGERDTGAFLQSGSNDATFLDKEALGRDGKSLKNFDTILDLGCGCGRLTRWLRPLADPWATIHGADTDQAAIAWCKANITDAIFTLHGEHPPLPFADNSIDLVLAYSTFTHLDAESQLRWLAELQRILRPGGYLVAAFQYRRGIGMIRDQTVRDRVHDDVARSGVAFVTSQASESGAGHRRGMAYHAPEYVRRQWGSYFEVRHILATGTEEIAVLRARESTFLQRVFQRP